MKKSLMLLQSEFPPDIRLEKEIRALSKAGYKVTLLCNNFTADKNKITEYENCEIVRLTVPFQIYKLNKLINFPIFFNPRYLFQTIKIVRHFEPDVIHAHDLPMVPIALFIKKIFGIPVIYDMHENYPAALKVFDKKGLVNTLFKNPRFAQILDDYCIKKVDSIITVVDENKDRVKKMGIGIHKVNVVSNTLDIDEFMKRQPQTKFKYGRIEEKYNGKFILLYTGGVSPDRGLTTAIEAMLYVKIKIPEAFLIIIGDGPTVPVLKEIIKENCLEDFVELIKWPGHENLAMYWERANIGIIPQPNNEFINYTVPHKLFEFMYHKMPLLVADSISLKRIIEEANCGMAFKSNDPNDFAEKALAIKNSNIPFGENGYKSVISKYNWNKDQKELINLYSKILNL